METIASDNNLPAAANGNRRSALAFGQSIFPSDAVARIFRPSRSVMTSGRARTKGWRLAFERRTPPFIEPLMGWTGGGDTLTQVELNFPTLEAAIAYAERQGLAYVVDNLSRLSEKQERAEPPSASEQAFQDALSAYLSLAWLQTQYGRGGPSALFDLERALVDPASVFHSPADVVADPALTLQNKCDILKRWAWDEYLWDLATAEGMPEGERPSRLHEVELALLALEEKSGDNLVVTTAADAAGPR
jgi:hypothetical protein